MNLPRPDPWAIWHKLACTYSADEQLVASLYQDLARQYSEPHRYYHTWDHIEFLLGWFDQYADRLEKQEVVLFSIFYHDVVYTPGRGDNEQQSALWAREALAQLTVPEEIIEDVVVYIQATSNHTLPPAAGPDLKYFIDFDLSILAADRPTYRDYLLNVRKEYGFLSPEAFASGRKAFIQAMLRKERIFYTEAFRSREEQARKNMQWELQMSPGIFSAG